MPGKIADEGLNIIEFSGMALMYWVIYENIFFIFFDHTL